MTVQIRGSRCQRRLWGSQVVRCLIYGVLGAGNGTGLNNPQPAISVYIHDVFVRF